MRHICNLLLLILTALRSQAQDYTVTKVSGVVYNGTVQLAKGDKLNDLNQLRATTPTAALRLISNQTGTIPISFAHGVRIAPDAHATSAWYQLIVGQYIASYTTYKSMKSKGAPPLPFDWFDFFYSAGSDTASSSRRLLIIKDEHIPLHSTSFHPSMKFQLLACTYLEGGDSISRDIPMVNDSMVLASSCFPDIDVVRWRLKLRYTDSKGQVQIGTVTDNALVSTLLSPAQLLDIAKLFSDDEQSTNTSRGAINAEVLTYLGFNYGKVYEAGLDRYMKF